MTALRCVLAPALAALWVGAVSNPFAQGASTVEFDRDIRPIFTKHCVKCHGSGRPEAGLRLTDRESATARLESGARAIVPARPDESELIRRVTAADPDVRMPPEGSPLSAEQIALLRQWITADADWPVHWAYRPVVRPEPPRFDSADQESWIRNPIDRFVFEKLAANELRPSVEADQRTLLRRVFFDLIGLPPSPEEIEQFLRDESPSAYEALVDRLLDSPDYGERWARHWLDVVRFGESQGYERNRIRENAWRYRDWVIDAFNRDLPYDQFIRLQVAGDVLAPQDLSALIATGYHVCGTWDQVGHLEGSQEMRKAARQDHLEDLVGTLGQAFLGLTINCARCHDHKFDAISQRDYYQIAAALGGVTQQEPERQVAASFDPVAERQVRAELDARRAELAELQSALRRKAGSAGEKNASAGLQVLYRFEPGQAVGDQSGVGTAVDLKRAEVPPFASLQPASKLIAAAKASGEVTIEAWITPGKASQSGPARIVTLSQDTSRRNFTLGQDGDRWDVRFRTTKTDQNGLPSLAGPSKSVHVRRTHVVYTFDRTGTARLYVDGKQTAEKQLGGDLSNWDDNYRLAVGDELTGERRWDGAVHFVALYNRALSAEEVAQNFRTESRDVRGGRSWEELLAHATAEQRRRFEALRGQVRTLDERLKSLQFEGPLHVIVPQQPPVFHVLQRGDYRKPLDVVAPGGLQVLEPAGLPADFGLRPDAPEADRRVRLAQWLTDPRNPLTPRVLVNRLWHYHFGRGIVETPSEFGMNGGRPSHPELLDWLARELVDGGWKIKPLQRLIVTSAAYRQSSRAVNSRAAEIDAENRLLWRANRRQLEGEAVRDAALLVSGALNRQRGGPSFRDVNVKLDRNHEFTDPTGEFSEAVNRRTIYRLWARSGNHPLLDSLDCPDPSVMAPQRTRTITPVQALALINGRFTQRCAERFAERIRQEAGDDVDARISRAYLLALAREPRPAERELARDFALRRGLEQLCLVLMNTNEFLFVE